MCDSITNGGVVYTSGAASSCPPANVIIASNVLNTNGNVICGNIIAQDGTFTGNLYVTGSIIANISYATLNVFGLTNTGSIVSDAYYGNAFGLSNLNASNLVGAISNANLPVTGVAPGQYGSSANVFQGTVDQYGRITQAANIAILSSQWTTIDGNVAYQNGVTIGTLSNPPPGSNLLVRGTANIDTLNVGYLTVNSAVVYGATTLNVYGVSNLNTVVAGLYSGNASGLSNLTGANVTGVVGAALVVTGNAQPNITSVGVLSALTVQGLLTASNASALSNIPGSNVVGTVATALSVTTASQPNITSVGTLTGLTVQGLLTASNASGLSNIQGSNVVGNVASAVIASAVTGNAQTNITSVGTLTGLTVQGLLTASNASGLSNITGSNVVGTVATALSVTTAAQPNITSVGTLSSLDVSGLITGTGQALSSINGSNVSGTVGSAQVVTQAAQPAITSVGTLSSLGVSGGVTAALFTGSGAGLTNIPVGNIVGTVTYAYTAGSVVDPAQTNITSVGSLTSLTVVGTVTGGTFSGDGTGLLNVPASAIVGTVGTAQSVTAASQPNITSVGTLSSLAVSGLISGTGQALSSINGSNVSTVPTALSVTASSQPNITSVGTLSSLAVSGIMNAGLLVGNASGLSNLTGANVVGVIPLAQSVTGAAQPNITSVGLLSNLAVSNSVTTTNVFASFANVSGRGIFGTVGIGIANPFGQLEVSSPLPSTTVTLSMTDATTGTGFGAALVKDTAQNFSVVNYQAADLLLGTNLTTRMRLYSAGGQSILGPVAISAGSLTSPSLTGANLQVTGNVYASNALTAGVSLQTPLANVGTLNVWQISNLQNLTVLSNLSVPTANIATLNVSSLENVTNLVAGVANVDTLNVGVISNLNSLTLGTALVTPLANVGTLNVWQISNLQNLAVLSNLSVPTANVSTLNVIAISNLNSLTTNIVSAFANVSTLNVWQISNLQGLTLGSTLSVPTANVATLNVYQISNLQNLALGSNLSVPTANVSTLNVLAISNLNSLTTNVVSTFANVGTLNVWQISNLQGLTLGSTLSVPTANIATLNVYQISNLQNLALGSNLSVPTANVTTLNVIAISNLNSLTTNVVSTFANVGTLNVWQISNLQGLTLGSNLSVPTANVTTLNVIAISNLNSLTTNVVSTFANVGTLNVWQISNLQNLAVLSNLSAPTANVGTLNVLTISNLNSLTTNVVSTFANVGTLNVWQISNLQGLTLGSNLSVPTANVGTLNVIAISNLNSLSLANLNVSYTANLANLFVTTANVSNLYVTSNILPGVAGNTYIVGNVVVSGNVFSALGSPLGAGGGYYFSLPSDIALQPSYTGPVGTARPLSVGLSNGFTINGTSTFITVTSNGNFKFSQAGPYMLSAVFAGSDNLLGLAVGSNVADIHGTDQGYLYRYTTFVSQNPTELIEIPINVTDATKYYYLDLFAVDGGQLRATADTSGGTYLTITPLTGGGLATGGPGGTPGTQWISSGSNIYFPNSVGIGAVNPAYNLDVIGDIHATGNVYSAQRVVTNQSVTYTANALDYYIGVNGVGVTINLPQGSTLPVGKTYVIKDESGLAATNHITVAPYSGNLIDGQTALNLVVNYLAVSLIWTGARWSIV